VDAVIQLPVDLFFGTTIGTCILVLKKSKTDNKVVFIDASREFSRQSTKNVLLPENQKTILQALEKRENIDHFVSLKTIDEIAERDYLLSVSSYVQSEDKREIVDIAKLNLEISEIVARQNELRFQIDKIVKELDV